MKLGRKDYTISVKTGTEANKAKFKKECVQGEIYYATDTGFFYVAEVTAGANDATLSQFAAGFTNQYSVSFDGTDDYMGSLPIDRLGSSTWSTTTAVSQSAWVKIISYANLDGVFGIGRNKNNGSYNTSYAGSVGGFHMYNSALYFYLGGNTGVGSVSATINTGVWYLLTWTWDGTDGNIYVNDQLDSTFTHSSNGFNTNFSIWAGGGGRWNSYGNVQVDEVAVWDSEISLSNVQTIYGSGVPSDISSLSPLVWYRMGDGTEGGTGSDIYDMSGNSRANGKLFNTPTFSTNVP